MIPKGHGQLCVELLSLSPVALPLSAFSSAFAFFFCTRPVMRVPVFPYSEEPMVNMHGVAARCRDVPRDTQTEAPSYPFKTNLPDSLPGRLLLCYGSKKYWYYFFHLMVQPIAFVKSGLGVPPFITAAIAFSTYFVLTFSAESVLSSIAPI